MANLTLRERLFLVARAVTGSVSQIQPGTVGYDLLNRLYPYVGEPPKRGTVGMLEAYSTSPWLRAVCDKIGRATAACAWKLYVVRPQGGERDPRTGLPKAVRMRQIQRAGFAERRSLLTERERAGDLVQLNEHVLLEAMDRGNPYLIGLPLRKLTQIYLDTVGECVWLKERSATTGKPIAFWPIPPSWVMQLPTVGWPFLRVSAGGWQANIPDTEILWMVDPDPLNPYGRGSGPGMAVADEIDTDQAMASTVKQKFFNRARPDLVVMPKAETDTLSEPDAKRMELHWKQQSQGFWKWFKPFFSTRALEIKELSQDLQALQFVELRQHERDMILQVTGGLPPEMLGILENSNRSTIDSAKYLFDTQVVVPRMEFQRAYFQEKLVPEYDERIILDYESPVQADGAAKLAAMSAAPWAATVDEWRIFQGLEPKEDGSGRVHMLPVNLTPVDTLEPEPAPEEPPLPSRVPPPVVPPGPEPEAAPVVEAVR